MKSIKNVETISKKYPWIGISELQIVILFISQNKGIVLHQEKAKLGGDIEIGGYSDSILEPSFTEFKGTITISN